MSLTMYQPVSSPGCGASRKDPEGQGAWTQQYLGPLGPSGAVSRLDAQGRGAQKRAHRQLHLQAAGSTKTPVL